jgi:penicillin-binding protein 2
MLDFLSLRKFRRNNIQFAFKEDIEPHEILLDSLAEKEEKQLGLSEKKFEVPLLKKIIQGFFIFCFLIISFLLFKTFQLQVVEGKDFVQLAERNKFIIRQIQAERGVIYDKNMEQLVFNKSTFDLVCGEEVVENLSHQELILFEARNGEHSDCRINTNVVREYKEGEIFAQILGYTARINNEELVSAPEFYSASDYVGRTGTESYYEKYLRKNPGKLRVERDALGQALSQEIISLPESGESLVLWLDADLQRKLSEELKNKYEEIGAGGAAAVAMDPKTGGILALVSLPSFDNNLFQKGADAASLQSLLDDPQNLNPLFNRAISGRYLTGSSIKPLLAAAALQEGIISPEKQIYSPGYIEVPHQYDPEITYKFRDNAIHGWVDVKKAIAQSCNVYFYSIGGGYGEQVGLGPTKIKEYLEMFGWTMKTGIDLPGEATGFVPDIEWKKETLGEGWWDGNTYYLSIGQEYLQITPLEVATSIAAVANGGKLLKPQVVREIISGSSDKFEVIEEFNPEVLKENFIDPENLEIVREGMRQAVTGFNSPLASAVILNSLPVSSAAKTGTAELGNDRYHNWITVFAPYEDPKIVLTVMVENVKGVQAAVLPVVREVLEWYFTEKIK